MKIGIIGCGNMGAAFARGFDRTHHLFLYDADRQKAKKLSQEIKAHFCDDLSAMTSQSEVILLAIKPKDMVQLAEEITFSEHHTVVSMLSGVSLKELEEAFGDQVSFVRIMPNLGVQNRLGVIGAVQGSLKSKESIEGLLKEVGLVVWLDETRLDSLTALSGCGPAFVFLIVEAFIEAGISMGLAADIGRELTIKTFEGALEMLKKTDQVPCALKWQVTSPGGDTIRGLCEMERLGLKSALIQGIVKARP